MDIQKILLNELKNLEKDELIKMILDLLEENRKMMEALIDMLRQLANELEEQIKLKQRLR